MKHRSLSLSLVLAAVLGGCTEDQAGTTAPDFRAASAMSAGVPGALATVSFAGASVDLWPYTTDDFVSPKDPVNLVFFGDADPRTIRAALIGLSGDRTAFGLPATFPFNCRWTDVPDGGIQSVYTAGGWEGSTIQLGCGDYSQVRFHMRLFRSGGQTVGAVHFEFLVPGTTEHRVLSWEAAEQFVALDMYRTGIAAPVDSSAINAAPSFRTLEAMFVGLLPAELKAVLCPAGVPWPCDGSADVPIVTNGYATIIYLFGGADAPAGSFRRNSTVNFDQVIPKPFCAGGAYQYLYVNGPIAFREQWVVTPSNNYVASFRAQGTLTIVPIDPTNGQPLAAPYTATVSERHRMQITDQVSRAAQAQLQVELPPDAPYHGRLDIRFSTGPNGNTSYSVALTCN